MIEKALKIAIEAHSGQLEKDGNPYIMHPLRLMSDVETVEEKCVALLHDVAEDTDVSIEEIREAFPPAVADAVALMTHDDGSEYEVYIKRLAENPIARKVKMADMRDNMNILRIPKLSDKDLERLRKYHTHYRFLESL